MALDRLRRGRWKKPTGDGYRLDGWDELREAIPPAYSRYLAQFIPLPTVKAA
jgi:hypothetical protein